VIATGDDFEISFGEMSAHRKSDFLAAGYRGRHFFAHRVFHLPKCGPDGFRLAERMCSERDPNRLSELVLYAAPELAAKFPDDLWFDDDLIWHQQQFGRAGQVATVNLRQDGDDLYTMVLVSDLVQRVSRRRDHKSRVEDRFRWWPRILLNAILARAMEMECNRVFIPKSHWAMKHTDRNRVVQAELFERIYDRPVARYEPAETGDWWIVDLAGNRDRIIALEAHSEPARNEKTICICHDIERGLGHIHCDPEFSRMADQQAPENLRQMLEIERSLGISATYSVVGSLLNEVRPLIENTGHEVAFHSYNHVISQEQLELCRSLDYRIKGYRPPQSRVTSELTDMALCHHNFEWLASSAYSLGFKQPRIENRIAKLPILFDEYAMYTRDMTYEKWRTAALEKIESSKFVAFSLHDCYAGLWLDDYHSFLLDVLELGSLKTLNEVAADLVFQESFRWRK
jgi:hypothetical protein